MIETTDELRRVYERVIHPMLVTEYGVALPERASPHFALRFLDDLPSFAVANGCFVCGGDIDLYYTVLTSTIQKPSDGVYALDCFQYGHDRAITGAWLEKSRLRVGACGNHRGNLRDLAKRVTHSGTLSPRMVQVVRAISTSKYQDPPYRWLTRLAEERLLANAGAPYGGLYQRDFLMREISIGPSTNGCFVCGGPWASRHSLIVEALCERTATTIAALFPLGASQDGSRVTIGACNRDVSMLRRLRFLVTSHHGFTPSLVEEALFSATRTDRKRVVAQYNTLHQFDVRGVGPYGIAYPCYCCGGQSRASLIAVTTANDFIELKRAFCESRIRTVVQGESVRLIISACAGHRHVLERLKTAAAGSKSISASTAWDIVNQYS
ncbi:MAG: hypothetical protein ABIG71_03720 [Candidatus Uhrbacteria bacterium]